MTVTRMLLSPFLQVSLLVNRHPAVLDTILLAPPLLHEEHRRIHLVAPLKDLLEQLTHTQHQGRLLLLLPHRMLLDPAV